MSKFAVNEIAICLGSPTHPGAAGLECRILSPFGRYNGFTEDGRIEAQVGYRVEIFGYPTGSGMAWAIEERRLRKKPPDSEEVGSWGEVWNICEWWPEGIVVAESA